MASQYEGEKRRGGVKEGQIDTRDSWRQAVQAYKKLFSRGQESRLSYRQGSALGGIGGEVLVVLMGFRHLMN